MTEPVELGVGDVVDVVGRGRAVVEHLLADPRTLVEVRFAVTGYVTWCRRENLRLVKTKGDVDG